jgi:large subunit ribosomal protein L7A
LTELASSRKVVGVKQSRKALREGRAAGVFLAADADPAITGPVRTECGKLGVSVNAEYSMAQLGHACRIPVGASVVALLKD